MARLLAPLALLLALAAAPLAQTAPTAYPNPLADGPLTVRADAPGAAFELYDLLGRTLDPRADLAPGVYLWRLRHADGSATAAQRLTRLARGPLEVRLATGAAAAPGLLTSAGPLAPEAPASCAPAPGGVLFAGVYHAGAPGTALSRGGTMRVQNPEGAAFSTCLPGVRGVSAAFPSDRSPWSTAAPAIFGTTYGGDISGEAFSASFLIEPDGLETSDPSAVIRGGLDPATAREVEVIRYDASGAPAVVASATVPAGTPLSTPSARLLTPALTSLGDYLVITMTNVTAAGWLLGADGSVRNDVFAVQFDFATDTGSPVWIALPGQEPVQGDAVSLTAQVDGVVSLDEASMDASTSAFEVAALRFGTSASGWPNIRPAKAPASGAPAWLRMQDPNGLMTDASTMEIRCGQGEACARYGVEAAPGFIAFGEETTTGLKTAPEAFLGVPTAQSFRAGPFSAAPGRGVLLDRFDELRTDAYYRYELANKAAGPAPERRAVVTFGKPRADLTSIRVDDLPADPSASGGAPAFTRYELRYIRNGSVRLRRTLPAGQRRSFTVANLEITDSFATFGAETTVKAGGSAGGPVFRYAVSLQGGNEFIEIRPTMEDPTATGFAYQKIIWTYSDPWTAGFITFGSETGLKTAPEASAKADMEGWVFLEE